MAAHVQRAQLLLMLVFRQELSNGLRREGCAVNWPADERRMNWSLLYVFHALPSHIARDVSRKPSRAALPKRSKPTAERI